MIRMKTFFIGKEYCRRNILSRTQVRLFQNYFLVRLNITKSRKERTLIHEKNGNVLKEINYKDKKQNNKRVRPIKYQDSFNLAIFLYQTLKQYSCREVLQELRYFGFKTPSLNDYHYRVKQFDKNTLKSFKA